MARGPGGPDIPPGARVLVHDSEGIAYVHGRGLVIDMAYYREGQVHVVLPTNLEWLALFHSFLETACDSLARQTAGGQS